MKERQTFYYNDYIIRIRKQKPVGLYAIICDKYGGVLKHIPNIDSIQQGHEIAITWIDDYFNKQN